MADKMTNATVKLFLDGKEIKNSVADIEKEMRQLKKTQKDLVIGSEEYTRTGKQIRELNGILATHRASIRNTATEYQSLSQRLGKVADGFNRYMGLMAGAVGAVTGLTLTVRKTVQQYAEMQEAEAQVRKYTGMTADEVERLNEEFKKMDTRTSREELNALAGDAGRLGITSREAIMEFVDGADKIKVALGDDLGETAVRDIGKLAQMFGEDKKKGLRGAMLATGSAVNELAQNSSASAGAIVEFTARLAGLANQAGMTQAQIMGIGSVMDQNMQEIPTSATVISQLITKMMQDTSRFAKLAGKDVSEFSNLLRTDANAALVQFLQAMKSRGGFADMASMFEDMNLDGTRAVGVLSALAGHLDQLAEAQSLANQSYEEGVSVINEFNVQNTTVQAELDKAKKRFADLSIELGEKLMPIAKYGITTGSAMVKMLSTLVTFFTKYSGTVIMTTAAIIGYTVATNASEISTMTFYRAIVKVKVAVKELWALIAHNPWAALGMAVSAVLVIFADYISNVKDTITFEQQLNDIRKDSKKKVMEEKENLDLLIKAAQNENLTIEARKEAINKLNKLIPDYNAQLDATTGKYKANKKALDDYLISLQRKYELEGAKDLLTQVSKEISEEQLKNNEAVENLGKARSLQQSTTKGSRHYGMSQAETMFLSTNTSQAETVVDESNKRLEKLLAKRQKIYDTFGEDLMREAALAGTGTGSVQPESPTSPTDYLSDKERKKLEKEAHQREVKEARERREALARIEAEYTEKQDTLRKQYVAGEIRDRNELNEQLENLEHEKLEAMLGVANLEPKKRAEINSKLVDLQMKLKEKLETFMEDLGVTDEEQTQDELNALKTKFDEERSIIQQAYNRELMTKEEYQEADRKLTAKYDDDVKKAKEKGAEKLLAIMETAHEKELLELEERRVQTRMSEEDYNEELYALHEKWIKKELELVELSEEKRNDLQNALRQQRLEKEKEDNKKEEALLKEKFSDLLNAADSFGQAFGDAMEDLFSGEKDALKHFLQDVLKQTLDFIEKLMVAKIGQRTIDNIGTLGLPGIAKAAAEAALITAAFETAKAAIGSFASGGFTGSGAWNEEKGVVHANEFVANRFATGNPSVMPVLSLIDAAQKSGSVSNLTSSDIASVLPEPKIDVKQQDFTPLLAMLNAVNQTNRLLLNRLQRPITAETYASGRGGVNEAQDLLRKMKSNVSRGRNA